jgi:hypothetical protein
MVVREVLVVEPEEGLRVCIGTNAGVVVGDAVRQSEASGSRPTDDIGDAAVVGVIDVVGIANDNLIALEFVDEINGLRWLGQPFLE